MKHIHHIVPRHMGGSDDPSNLISLSVEDHAEAHRLLYESHGCWQDFLAWQGLSKRMACEEVVRKAASLPNIGQRRSVATEFKKGDKPKSAGKYFITNGDINKVHDPELAIPEGWIRGLTKSGYTNNGKTGKYKRSDITKDKLRQNRKGKGLGDNNAMASEENRKKVSLSKIGRKRIYRKDGSFYMSKI